MSRLPSLLALAWLAGCEPSEPAQIELRVTLGEGINADVIRQLHVRIAPTSSPEPPVTVTSSKSPAAGSHGLAVNQSYRSPVRVEVLALDREAPTVASDLPVLATGAAEVDAAGKPIRIAAGLRPTVAVTLACVEGVDCRNGNLPPRILALAPAALAEGDEKTVNVLVTDPDGDAVSLAIDGAPAWAAVEAAATAGAFKVNLAPGPRNAGAYDLVLRATDAATSPLAATATLHVEVAETPYVVSLDGLGDRIDAGTLTAGAQLTLEAWFNRSASGVPLGDEVIAALTAGGGLEVRIAAVSGGADGKLSAAAVFPGASSAYASTDLPTDGEWHHAALTLGASGLKLYLDGTEMAAGAISPPAIGAAHAWFGGTPAKPYALLGDLDELRVFSVERATPEVAADMSGPPPTAGLLRHYPLDDGEGKLADDLSPESADATLVGDAAFRRDPRLLP